MYTGIHIRASLCTREREKDFAATVWLWLTLELPWGRCTAVLILKLAKKSRGQLQFQALKHKSKQGIPTIENDVASQGFEVIEESAPDG